MLKKLLILIILIALSLSNGLAASEIKWLMLIENETDTWSRDLVSRYIEKSLDVDIAFINEQNNSSTALIVMLASEEVPDLITIPRESFKIQQLIQQNMIWDFDELECVSEIVQAMGEDIAEVNRNSDGKLYLFPGGVRLGQQKEVALTLPAMLVRDDILQQVGYSAKSPESFFESIMEIAACSEVGLGLMPFDADGCVSLDRYLPESLGLSDIEYGRPWLLLQNNEYIEWLKVFSQIYLANGMDREVFTIDRDRIGKQLSTGSFGCFWGDAALFQEELEAAQYNGYIYTAVEPPKGAAPGYILDRTKDFGLYATVIPKKAKDANLSAFVLSKFGSKEGQEIFYDGVEGMMWSMSETGKVINKTTMDLYNDNIAKFNMNDGGAYKYDFLSCYDKTDCLYGTGSLYDIYSFYEPLFSEETNGRKVRLMVMEKCVKEEGLMTMRWGNELPALLSCDAEEFKMISDHMLDGFINDGLYRYTSEMDTVIRGGVVGK